jgi:hypothetical protein
MTSVLRCSVPLIQYGSPGNHLYNSSFSSQSASSLPATRSLQSFSLPLINPLTTVELTSLRSTPSLPILESRIEPVGREAAIVSSAVSEGGGAGTRGKWTRKEGECSFGVKKGERAERSGLW